jgi:hypothetical protein
MQLFDSKKGILRLKIGTIFKLMPQLAAFCLGPIPVSKIDSRRYNRYGVVFLKLS